MSRWKKSLGILGCIWGIVVLYPVRFVLLPSFMFGDHLLVLQNSAELRPCGGFTTAIGRAQVIPPRFDLRNVYALPKTSLGTAPEPLDQVTTDLHLWDVGTSPDPATCAADHAMAYQRITGESPTKVWLVPSDTVETMMHYTGSVQIDGQTIDKNSVFAFLSRSVADTDRHNIVALANRKSSLSVLAKKLVIKTLLRPWQWHRITRSIGQQVRSGDVFISGVSRPHTKQSDDVSLVLWNLGGAKSNRYVIPKLTIRLTETTPNTWTGSIIVTLEHTGLYEEPINQDWQGIAELHLPRVFGREYIRFDDIVIAPQDTWQTTVPVQYTGDLRNIAVYSARGHGTEVDAVISAYPQQALASDVLAVREATGRHTTTLKNNRIDIQWQQDTDTVPPFVTFHTLVPVPQHLREQIQAPYMAEIHMSEAVRFAGIKTDIENLHTADPVLMENNRTMLVPITNEPLPHMPYTLRISGLQDTFGNSIVPDRTWTVILK